MLSATQMATHGFVDRYQRGCADTMVSASPNVIAAAEERNCTSSFERPHVERRTLRGRTLRGLTLRGHRFGSMIGPAWCYLIAW